ncbi:MAG: PEP-CTERM sorting domain-containing protein, partial [Candidatus Schekmanbacteria bacterium]|nr:PEP-CTERM sorting domain-containing protein [Candidatus Schekmanbacteria bacterium]
QSYFNGTWDNNDPRTADWAFHALVQPVPEPSTLLLIGFGITGMAVWKKRRK